MNESFKMDSGGFLAVILLFLALLGVGFIAFFIWICGALTKNKLKDKPDVTHEKRPAKPL